MIKKSILKTLTLLFVCLCICCAAPSDRSALNAPNNGSAPPSAKTFKLAFVTNNASDYWTIARKGVEKADTELNEVTVDFKMPGSGAADEQKRIIDDVERVEHRCIATRHRMLRAARCCGL